MMEIGIYAGVSAALAVLIHIGAAAGPPDKASSAIEERYLSGGFLKAAGTFLIWVVLGYVSFLTQNWWLPALLAIPGGAALRFAVLNVARPRK